MRATLLTVVVLGTFASLAASCSIEDNVPVRFDNQTDQLLCADFWHPPTVSGYCTRLDPLNQTMWAPDCGPPGSVVMDVYVSTESGEILYANSGKCDEWDGTHVTISQDGGRFEVRDDLRQPELHESWDSIDLDWDADGKTLAWLVPAWVAALAATIGLGRLFRARNDR